MTVKSYRKERMVDLRRTLLIRNHAAGHVVQQAAKRYAPVDTGLLRAHITFTADLNEVLIGPEGSVQKDSPFDYFLYQELGSRRNNPHPYLVPGLRNSRSEIERVYSGGSAGRRGALRDAPTDDALRAIKPPRRLR